MAVGSKAIVPVASGAVTDLFAVKGAAEKAEEKLLLSLNA
jgi:hypothetical protein